MLEQFGIYLNGGAHDQCVGILQLIGQLPVKLIMGDQGPARFAQQIHGRRRNFFGDNDFHQCPLQECSWQSL